MGNSGENGAKGDFFTKEQIAKIYKGTLKWDISRILIQLYVYYRNYGGSRIEISKSLSITKIYICLLFKFKK